LRGVDMKLFRHGPCFLLLSPFLIPVRDDPRWRRWLAPAD